VSTENAEISTPISRKDPIQHSRCKGTLIGEEISTPSSPVTSITSEDDYIFSRGSRKRSCTFPDSPGEQSVKKDEDVDKQESMPSCSSQNVTPVSVSKKPKVVKTKDDAVPLPDPFPLPKYYRADVETALANGKMTKENMSTFLSAIAAAMLVFKRYPTSEDYICVARSVLQKYSFMSSPAGTPYVSILADVACMYKIG
jgi:hypothetical protein